MIQHLKNFVCRVLMYLFRVFPLQEKVVLQSYNGAYSDNPRALFEAMKKIEPNLKYIWLMDPNNQEIPGAIAISRRSIAALYHLATAKIWINNRRMPIWMCKRKGQYYVQTWHGGIALKKVEADVEDRMSARYIASAKNDSKMADLFLSGSQWRTQNYLSSFWYQGEILECGSPKSDLFYRDGFEINKKVREFYKLPSETHLLLYAPTFRADHSLAYYNMDCSRLLQEAEKKWGGKWKLLLRLHPNIQSRQSELQYNGNILNGSAYSEINELIIASDILITDYSSCMFDAMEAGKKVFLYVPDLEAYDRERGTYLSLHELPFPMAENNQELMSIVANFDETTFQRNVSLFAEKLGICNNAHGAQKAAEYIIEHSGVSAS